MTSSPLKLSPARLFFLRAFGVRIQNYLAAFAVFAILAGVAGCHASLDTRPDADIDPHRLFMFSPLTAPSSASGLTAARVNLGRSFYYDRHFSENNSISCNGCHQLSTYGADPHPVSFGHNHKPGGRNAPTVYNSGLQFVQFWDGRAATLAAQAAGPMMNPVEMGMSGPSAVLAYVRANPAYVEKLRTAYPTASDPVSMDNITDSIADFEGGLLTPSRWDKYLQGDTSALSNDEKQGLRVFLRSGCAACHAGEDMGGNSYEQLGAYHDWKDQYTDQGRFQTTHDARDKMFFKVPTLRNIEMTGPYFHDGHVKTLDEAVRLMGKYEVGEDLSDADVHSIVVFLHALTGEIPWQYIQPPANETTRPAKVAENNDASSHRNTTHEGGQ
jgi:cytochrome c peroxidase